MGGKDGVGDEYATMSIPALLTWVREEACGTSSSSSSSSSLRPEVCYNSQIMTDMTDISYNNNISSKYYSFLRLLFHSLLRIG